jgi:hypothetical protein
MMSWKSEPLCMSLFWGLASLWVLQSYCGAAQELEILRCLVSPTLQSGVLAADYLWCRSKINTSLQVRKI